jgi:RNA polymerase sigma-70 factor (ECF subfamily)
VFGHDPLADPAPLIRRVYAYVSYRLGDGPEAEDVTSEVFESAVRYRSGFDSRRGEPIAWLFGIARRRVAWSLANRPPPASELVEQEAPGDVESETVERVALDAALQTLSERDQELLALRYGSDLRAREIGWILGLKTNTVEVALHRALERLREAIGDESSTADSGLADAAEEPV